MSACDECRDDFDAMSRLVESLPDDMKTSNCVLNAEMLLVALAYQKAEKENAKLRELVRDMWRFTGTACKKYPRLFDPSAQGGQMVYPNMLDSFEQRMRELGVEVDG